MKQSSSVGMLYALLSPEIGTGVDQLWAWKTSADLPGRTVNLFFKPLPHANKDNWSKEKQILKDFQKSVHADFEQEANTDEHLNSKWTSEQQNICVCISATVFSLYWSMLWFTSES